jgi:hypothetical protein
VKRRSAYFPGPANQTCPLQHRRNYHLSACLFCSLLFCALGPQFTSPLPVSQSVCLSVPPASQPVSHFLRQKDPQPVSPLDSTVRHHSRSIRPHRRWTSPSPAVRACVRPHAQHGSSLAPPKTPSGTLYHGAAKIECRSASNLPVSCTSCISCIS